MLARQALRSLGVAPAPLPRGERGAPAWPLGVVGSITHCDGYRGAAVAAATECAAVGVDAEPAAPLPDGVLATVATPASSPRPPTSSTGAGCCSAPRSRSTRPGSR
nr:hypothetical protein [Angustibacter aerolatus]